MKFSLFNKRAIACNVPDIPGSGFSPSGEGSFRLSVFGHGENVIAAVERMKKTLK